jgi:hypothetical protein
MCVSGVYQVRISHGFGRAADTCISDGMRRVSGVYQVRISHGFGRVADTCISGVSGVYQVRISHGFGRAADTCISGGMMCVSGVYQVRISRGFGCVADTRIRRVSETSWSVSESVSARISVVSGGPRGAWLIHVSGLYQRCIRRTEGGVADTCIRTVSALYKEDRGGRG